MRLWEVNEVQAAGGKEEFEDVAAASAALGRQWGLDQDALVPLHLFNFIDVCP